jgi:hypothetical protein
VRQKVATVSAKARFRDLKPRSGREGSYKPTGNSRHQYCS